MVELVNQSPGVMNGLLSWPGLITMVKSGLRENTARGNQNKFF